jgi:hypothetical protein
MLFANVNVNPLSTAGTDQFLQNLVPEFHAFGGSPNLVLYNFEKCEMTLQTREKEATLAPETRVPIRCGVYSRRF